MTIEQPIAQQSAGSRRHHRARHRPPMRARLPPRQHDVDLMWTCDSLAMFNEPARNHIPWLESMLDAPLDAEMQEVQAEPIQQCEVVSVTTSAAAATQTSELEQLAAAADEAEPVPEPNRKCLICGDMFYYPYRTMILCGGKTKCLREPDKIQTICGVVAPPDDEDPYDQPPNAECELCKFTFVNPFRSPAKYCGFGRGCLREPKGTWDDEAEGDEGYTALKAKYRPGNPDSFAKGEEPKYRSISIVD